MYLFVSPNFIRLMDRLFASPAHISADDADFFGDFAVDPRKSLADLGRSYEIDIGGEKPEISIAEFIERRLGGRTDIGDRIGCGTVELVVRDLNDDGSIKSVGVALVPHHTVSAQVPFFLNARELADRLRGRPREDR